MPLSMSARLSFWPLHRVFAGDDLDAGARRFVDASADGRVELEHADARPVGDDFDVHVLRAEVGLDVLGVVEREVPLAGVGVADLDDDLVALRACWLRLRGADAGDAGGEYHQRERRHGRAPQLRCKHDFSSMH